MITSSSDSRDDSLRKSNETDVSGTRDGGRTDDTPGIGNDSMNRSTALTRRGFCRSAGAVSLSLLGSKATARSTNGRVVFVYDDCPEEDYTQTYPVHRQEGVPGCIAAVSDRIGHPSWLSPGQLREMEGEGWEIMSHSVRHRALGEIAVTRDIEPGDTKVYVDSNFHKRVPGDRILVSDGDRTETFSVADGGEDSMGEYLVAERPLETAFAADDGVTERYTDELLRSSLAHSKKTLEGFGVDVSTIVLPFGQTRGRVQELIPNYYDALANEHHWGFNDRAMLDPYHLGRTIFREGELSMRKIGTFLDHVRDEDALGMFVGHSYEEGLPPSRVRKTIRMTKERDLEIVTLQDALSDFGVLRTNTATSTTNSTTSSERSSTTETRTSAEMRPSTVDSSETSSPSEESSSPSVEQIGAVSLLGALGLGVLTYSRRKE